MFGRNSLIALIVASSTQVASASTIIDVHFTIVENQIAPQHHTFRNPSARNYFTIDGDQVTDNNAGYIHQLRFGETFIDDNKLHHYYRIGYRLKNGDIYKDILYPDHHLEVIRVHLNRNGTCSANVRFTGIDNGRYTDYDSAGTLYENSSVHAENIVCAVEITAPQS